MGVESEGEEEVVALSDGEVDLLEHEGAADAEDDEALILSDEEEDEAEGADGEPKSNSKRSLARVEKRRLRELKKKQEDELERIREAQNANISKEGTERAKDKFAFLLAQTEIFAHFLSTGGDKPDSKKRGKEKKMTEEEEDRAMAESNAAEARQASSSDRCESTSLQA